MASTDAPGAALRPLQALRYDPDRVRLDDVVVPPYDVITPADRDRYVARSEHSAVRLVLPDSPSRAGRLLYEWRQSGVLVKDREPTLWWHVQDYIGPDGAEGSRSGFLSAVRLSDYSEGRVRPHEQTHAAAKAGQLELTRAAVANLSPVFGLYDDPDSGPREALRPLATGAPVMQVRDDDGTTHRFWPVTDAAAIAAVQEAMADRSIVIADGHHRYETALAYRNERRERDGHPDGDQGYDFILMHLVNLTGEGLAIYPTHRVVMGRREVSGEVLHAFDVSEVEAPPAQVEEALRRVPAGTVAFAVWRGAGRPALLCTLRDRGAVSMAMMGAPAPVRAIDSAVLEAVVLAPLLGLLDPGQFATTDSIRYVRELGAATAPVDQGDASAAFLLRAPTVEQVRAVAAAGAVMPQKSTYFFPKLYSGFLINPLDA
ncbi:MAG TPA: DUF1015 domain-containing protein [Gaiellales bacterium]|jgi:uncharacterized protein (DUF1015 family)